MPINQKKIKYMPGTYAQKRPDADQAAAQYIQDWENRRRKMTAKEIVPAEIAPSICFSRKIGAGALEIADIVSEKINFQVVDREILAHISTNARLTKKRLLFLMNVIRGG